MTIGKMGAFNVMRTRSVNIWDGKKERDSRIANKAKK
jgi:hypothetical protein